MKNNIFLLFSLMLSALPLMAQERAESNAEAGGEESSEKFKVALAAGYSHIPGAFEMGHEEKAVFVPSIGLDLFYSIHPKWALGLVADLELANYIVKFNREDLDREKSFILALLASYEVLPRWGLLAGGGIEFEKHKNLFVARAGTEYEFPLGKGWSVAPSLFFDFKEEYSTWTLGVGIGKAF